MKKTDPITIPTHYDTGGVITAKSSPAEEFAVWRAHAAANPTDWKGDEFTLADFAAYIGSMKKTTDPVQFQVTILYPDGYRTTLTHKGRFRWSRRTAQKHAREFQAKHGQQNKTELVEV